MEFWTNAFSSVARNERIESRSMVPFTGRKAETCAKRSSLPPRQTSAADWVMSARSPSQHGEAEHRQRRLDRAGNEEGKLPSVQPRQPACRSNRPRRINPLSASRTCLPASTGLVAGGDDEIAGADAGDGGGLIVARELLHGDAGGDSGCRAASSSTPSRRTAVRILAQAGERNERVNLRSSARWRASRSVRPGYRR